MVETKKQDVPKLTTIQVELFGLARILCGRREVQVAVPDQSSTKHLVLALSKACPQLVGQVIREDLSGLQESYTFNLNGIAFISHQQVELKTGNRILLFSSQAGG